MTTEQISVIGEIKEITANAVAKKQDAAKLNFPKIIEKIKHAASLGESQCFVSPREMNEYDKKLLEKEGFSVMLVDGEKPRYEQLVQYTGTFDKEWRIRW